MTKMSSLVGVRQVILYVADMARSVEFYEKVFELPHVYPHASENWGAEHWVTFDAGGFSLALHSGGTGTGHSDFDLVFFTPDIQSAHADLVKKGAECSEIKEPHPGVAFFSLIDPDGFSLTVSLHKG